MKKIYHPFHLVNSSPWPFLMGIAAINTAVAFVSYMHRFESSTILLIFGFINIILILFLGFYNNSKISLVVVVFFLFILFAISNPQVYADELVNEGAQAVSGETESTDPYKRTPLEWFFLGVRYSIAVSVIVGLWFWTKPGGNPGPGFPPGGNPGPGFPPGGNPGPGFPPGGNPGPGFPPIPDGGGMPQVPAPNIGFWDHNLVELAINAVEQYSLPIAGLLIGASVVFGEDTPNTTTTPVSSPNTTTTSVPSPGILRQEQQSSSPKKPEPAVPKVKEGKEEEEEEEEEEEGIQHEVEVDSTSNSTNSYELNFSNFQIPEPFTDQSGEIFNFFEEISEFLASMPEFGSLTGIVYPCFIKVFVDGVKIFVPYLVFNQFFFSNITAEQRFRLLDFPEFVETLLSPRSPLLGLRGSGSRVPGLINVVNQLGLSTMLHTHFDGASYNHVLTAIRNFIKAWKNRLCPTFGEVFAQILGLLSVLVPATARFGHFLRFVIKKAESNHTRISAEDLAKLKAFYELFFSMHKILVKYERYLKNIELIFKKSGLNYSGWRFPFSLKHFFQKSKKLVFICIL